MNPVFAVAIMQVIANVAQYFAKWITWGIQVRIAIGVIVIGIFMTAWLAFAALIEIAAAHFPLITNMWMPHVAVLNTAITLYYTTRVTLASYKMWHKALFATLGPMGGIGAGL